MDPPWWPADLLDSWVWSLAPDHFRVAFALIALAARAPVVVNSPMWGVVDVPAGGVLTSLDRLAERVGITKAVARRALDRLATGPDGTGDLGLIRIVSSPRGYTLAVLRDPSSFTIRAQQRAAQPPDANSRSSEPKVSDEHSESTPIAQQPLNEGAASTAALSKTTIDTGQLRLEVVVDEHSTSTEKAHGKHSDDTPPAVGGRGGSTRGSEISDPDLVDLEKNTVPAPESSESPNTKKPRVAADRIPENAWRTADYLRRHILDLQPTNVIGKRSWGPEVKNGIRFSWANEVRLMIEQDGRTWDEIKAVVIWLFNGQTAEPKFRIVVLSAEALRQKWDQILVAMDRQRAESSAPADTAPARERWS